MDDDPFLTWDAAYVLGALTPEDRHAYEQHLRECPRCSKAVSKLVGLPGLLARSAVDSGIDESADNDPPPPSLLPMLLTAVRRERNGLRRATAVACLLTAACLVAVVSFVGLRATTSVTGTAATAMTALGDVPITAQINLTDVAWGTKVEIHCQYPGPGSYSASGSYVLVVTDVYDHTQQIASWKVVPGTTPTIAAATDLPTTEISRIEVQTATGMPVLALAR